MQLAVVGLDRLDATGKLNEDTAAALMRTQLQDLPFVRALWLLDANGRTRYDTDAGNIGLDFSDRTYFQVHRSDPISGLHVEPPVRSRTTDGWLIGASLPIRSTDGSLTGVIVAAVDSVYFEQLWSVMSTASGGSVTLLDHEGVLMVSSPSDQPGMGTRPANLRSVPQLLAGSDAGQFIGLCRTNHQACLFSFRRLSVPSDLVVVVGSAQSRMLAPFWQLATVSVILWVLGSAAVLLLCSFLDRAWRRSLRSEEQLQEMARSLAMATDASGIGIWDWSLKTNQWSATPTYFTILGLAPREGLQTVTPDFDYVHPEDRAAMVARIESVLSHADDVPLDYEARMRHADGSYRWVSLAGRVLTRDEQGKPSRLLGVRMDITDRKKVELSLQHAKEFAENLLENANAIVVGMDRLGRVTLFNQAAQRITGHDAADLLGKSALEMLGMPNRFPPAPDGSRRALDGIGARFHEGVIVTRSGAQRQISWQNSAIMEDGQIVGILSFGIDDTERNLAEAALRTSEERFRQLAENIPQVFWLLDPVGREMLYCSAAYEVVWGRNCDGLFADLHSWIDAVHPDDQTRIGDRLLERQIRGGYDEEYRIVRPDGSIRWIRDRAFPIRDAQGKVYRVSGIADDITERRESLLALRESTRQLKSLSRRVLEAQETERRRLARELHDELGQSLTSLKISIQTQQRFGTRPAQESLSEYVAMVESALQQVRRLALALRPSMLDDLGLVPALRWMTEQTAARTSLAIHFRPALPGQVRLVSDVETACFRIVQEALTNITRYAHAQHVEIDLGREGDQLVLAIRDDGQGFDLVAARARAMAGGSLGVLGMQERAMLIGGALEIRTCRGDGCTVLLRCPWRVAAAR